MLQKKIAIFLLSIFLVSATAPSIISLIDGNSEITMLMDMNEEESKEKEPSKDAEPKIIQLNNSNLSLYGLALSDLNSFYFKKYAKPYLNLISPPPEHYTA